MKSHEYVILEISRERERQMQAEGWGTDHDDHHDTGEMAKAAACYAIFSAMPDDARDLANFDDSLLEMNFFRRYWPWERHWWKPKDRRRDLVRAAALLVAEIERLDRAAAKKAA